MCAKDEIRSFKLNSWPWHQKDGGLPLSLMARETTCTLKSVELAQLCSKKPKCRLTLAKHRFKRTAGGGGVESYSPRFEGQRTARAAERQL